MSTLDPFPWAALSWAVLPWTDHPSLDQIYHGPSSLAHLPWVLLTLDHPSPDLISPHGPSPDRPKFLSFRARFHTRTLGGPWLETPTETHQKSPGEGNKSGIWCGRGEKSASDMLAPRPGPLHAGAPSHSTLFYTGALVLDHSTHDQPPLHDAPLQHHGPLSSPRPTSSSPRHPASCLRGE